MGAAWSPLALMSQSIIKLISSSRFTVGYSASKHFVRRKMDFVSGTHGLSSSRDFKFIFDNYDKEHVSLYILF